MTQRPCLTRDHWRRGLPGRSATCRRPPRPPQRPHRRRRRRVRRVAGLPLAIALWDAGVSVHLGNLSFSQLELVDRTDWITDEIVAVTPDTQSPDWYFPERALARWLAAHDFPSTVHAFPPLGVQPLREAYRHLIDGRGVDAVVLVDGGTDILLRGDESDLGTPVEDMTSLAAVAGLDVPVKLMTSLGFGIDAYHGVNHVQVLENLAALDREGGYLGALSIPGHGREAALYRDAVADAQAATPDRPSIVNGQIADLDKLAARCLYLDRIENTVGRGQVIRRIGQLRDETTTRIPRAYPH